jgi:hypothetical protein
MPTEQTIAGPLLLFIAIVAIGSMLMVSMGIHA